MSDLHDIEDVMNLGTKTGTCGYYATRRAIPSAHVVAMPYQVLFSRETRKSLGISLKGSVVVVDEAHNTPEALKAIEGVRVGGEGWLRARDAMGSYLERYERRLNGKNAEYCRQINLVLRNVCKLLEKEKEGGSRVLDVNGFLFEAKLDNVNLMKVTRYIERSLLCRKLLGFTAKRREEEEKKREKEGGDKGQDNKAPFVSKVRRRGEGRQRQAAPTTPSHTHLTHTPTFPHTSAYITTKPNPQSPEVHIQALGRREGGGVKRGRQQVQRTLLHAQPSDPIPGPS
jgi:Rad3-related DNA helicase